MSDLQLLIDLHIDGDRQGPGGEAETQRALELAGLKGRSGLAIVDIGCGTGAATRCLARELDAHVTAVDFLKPFLDRLDQQAEKHEFAKAITTLEASMDALPFSDAAFDVIWSEGAIYNMGFENGIAAWRRFLKPGGVLAVSELTWFTTSRPEPLSVYWAKAYAGVDLASAKIAQLEASGYSLLGYFPLGTHCWLDNYYRPIQSRFEAFLEAHGNNEAAKAVIASEEEEIALYERYSDYVGYGFYIARKVD